MKSPSVILTALFIVTILFLTGCNTQKAGEQLQASPSIAEEDSESTKERVQKNLTVTIGIQQSLSPLLIAREKGWFEEAFAEVGVNVSWAEFQSGPPYFEAIAANRLDFGQVGNSPVIAGQAANIPFKIIANVANGLNGNGILVHSDSGIKDIRELKGKKVAVAKGSSAFNLLYQAIDQAGLKPTEVEIIQLQPDEAIPAFETKAVDAWAIWEPFITFQQVENGPEILVDGEDLNVYSPSFTIARDGFIKEHPELTVLFLKTYEKALQWQNEHLEEAIEFYSEVRKLDTDVVRRVIANTEPYHLPASEEIIQAQQQTADFQYELEAIKKPIKVIEVFDNSFIEEAHIQLAESEKK